MIMHDRIYLVSATTLAALLDVSLSDLDKIVALDCWPRPIELIAGCVRWNWDDCQGAVDDIVATREAAQPA